MRVLYSNSPDSPDGTPPRTVWIGGASGNFETAANWGPSFQTESDGTVSGQWDVFADSTIGAGATVTFNGPLDANLYSLQLAAGGKLLVQSGRLLIDGTGLASSIAGTLQVSGPAALDLSGAIINTGSILLAAGTGTFLGIAGVGIITVAVENHGKIIADTTGTLAIEARLTNAGLLEAAGSGTGAHHVAGKLAFKDESGSGLNVYNVGGSIEAVGGAAGADRRYDDDQSWPAGFARRLAVAGNHGQQRRRAD